MDQTVDDDTVHTDNNDVGNECDVNDDDQCCCRQCLNIILKQKAILSNL